MTDWGLLYLTAATLPMLAGALAILVRRRPAVARALVSAGLALTTMLAATGAVLYVMQHPLGPQTHPPQPWTNSITWLRLSQLGVKGYGQLGFAPDAPAVEMHLGYHIDALAWLMFNVVSVIALLTVAPAGRSLSIRSLALASFLVGAILHALVADNLLQLYFCWALASLATAWLVPTTTKVFLLHRVADVGLLLGVVILITATGTDSLVTSTVIVRDVTGKVVTEDGQPKSRITRLSLADALRTPNVDSHDNPFDEPGATAGQLCRVHPTRTARGRKKLELAEQGKLVVVWNQETRNGHYDRPERRRFDAFAADAASGHGKGLRTVTYWVLCLAGFGIVVGCIARAGLAPLHMWIRDAEEASPGVSALIFAGLPLSGLYVAARLFPVFAPPVGLTMTYLGGITAAFAAVWAFSSRGRPVVAYLSLYLVGLGFAALGVGGWAVAMTHGCLTALYVSALGLGSTSSSPVRKGLRWLLLLLILLLPLFQLLPTRPGVMAVLWSWVALDSRQALLLVLALAALAWIIPVLWRSSRDGQESETTETSSPRWSGALLLFLSFPLFWAEPVLHQSEPAAASEAGPLQDVGDQVANGYFHRGSWLRSLHETTGFGPQALALESALLVLLLVGLAAWLLRNRETVQSNPRAGIWRFGNLDRALLQGVVAPVRRAADGLDRLDRRLWPAGISATAALAILLAGAARALDDRVIGGTVRAVGWLFRIGRPRAPKETAISTTSSL